ncbi:hypothetical protein AHF37_11632 [Paragonimus kellicotti]|nr:hypothetical protein AHF37_11632 [Paragonimus kellicotti]
MKTLVHQDCATRIRFSRNQIQIPYSHHPTDLFNLNFHASCSLNFSSSSAILTPFLTFSDLHRILYPMASLRWNLQWSPPPNALAYVAERIFYSFFTGLMLCTCFVYIPRELESNDYNTPSTSSTSRIA